MSNEQPTVNVLSGNRVNRSTIVVAFVPTVIFSGIVAYAIWPWIWIIPYILGGIVAMAFIAILYAGYHHHSMLSAKRRQAHLASWLVANEHAAIYLRPNGDYYPISAEHQQAMLAPPEVTIREVQKVDDEKIIELHQKHISLRSIAKQLGYSLYAVQKVTSTWDAQVKAITDESHAKEKKVQPADWREQT